MTPPSPPPPAAPRQRHLIAQADARAIPLADRSVHCVVTSPPYFSLRDYGVAGQIGLEGTPDAYVAEMVRVFREVRRVMRDDATLWLNIGDSYASKPPGCKGVSKSSGLHGINGDSGTYRRTLEDGHGQTRDKTRLAGIKEKDLIGIPWLLAFALRADGWYLRQDIIWSKPNPMPESVTDRCTKAHEYLFLLTKSSRYYYDAEAIKEKSIDPESLKGRRGSGYSSGFLKSGGDVARTRTGFGKIEEGKVYSSRNRRDSTPTNRLAPIDFDAEIAAVLAAYRGGKTMYQAAEVAGVPKMQAFRIITTHMDLAERKRIAHENRSRGHRARGPQTYRAGRIVVKADPSPADIRDRAAAIRAEALAALGAAGAKGGR